jgi:hypothetical protein
VEEEAIDGPGALNPADFLAIVRKSVWKELDGVSVKIDPYRRNLQHAYLDLVNNKVNSNQTMPSGLPPEFAAMFASSADEKPFYRAELKSLNAAIGAALAKTSDRETRAHLDAARDQIAKILDPKFAPTGGTSGVTIRIGIDAPNTCWPDYVILP